MMSASWRELGGDFCLIWFLCWRKLSVVPTSFQSGVYLNNTYMGRLLWFCNLPTSPWSFQACCCCTDLPRIRKLLDLAQNISCLQSNAAFCTNFCSSDLKPTENAWLHSCCSFAVSMILRYLGTLGHFAESSIWSSLLASSMVQVNRGLRSFMWKCICSQWISPFATQILHGNPNQIIRWNMHVAFIASFTIHICLQLSYFISKGWHRCCFSHIPYVQVLYKEIYSNTMRAKHSTLWVRGDVWYVFNMLWCSITIQQIYFCAAIFLESMKDCFAVSHLSAKELKVL